MFVVMHSVSSEDLLRDTIFAILVFPTRHQAAYHAALVLAGILLSFYRLALAYVTLFFSTFCVTLLVFYAIHVPPFIAIALVLLLSVLAVRYAGPSLLFTVCFVLCLVVLNRYNMVGVLTKSLLVLSIFSPIKGLAVMSVCAGAALCADGTSFFATQVFGAESQTIVCIAVIFVIVAVAWKFAHSMNREYDQIP